MATILYLHGFASASGGPKHEALKAAFPQHDVLSPNVPLNPKVTCELLDKIVRENSNWPLIVVGTSLGGFWANYVAQVYDVPAVLINPSTDPAASMAKRLGKTFFNHRTNESIVVTEENVAELSALNAKIQELYNGALIDVLVAKDDDIIDYRQSLKDLKFWRSCTISEKGGHRYLEDWDKVIEIIKERIN